MSNLPQGPGQNRGGGMAVAALVLGIIGIVIPVVIPGLLALVFGIIALVKSSQGTSGSAKGMAIAGIVLGGLSVLCAPLMIAILLPSLGRARELANRTYCMANVRGVLTSMNVYAADGDIYPVTPYKEYGPGNAGTFGDTFTGTTDQAIGSIYKAGSPAAGSPLASVWILALQNRVIPKEFVCKSDPFAGGSADVQKGSEFYLNFQADNQISYSFQYPYDSEGKVSKMWTALTDASLPVMADMTPKEGTGNPVRSFAGGPGGDLRSQNSGNHGGQGQNVGYGDGHVSFERSPYVGQMELGGPADNIYTTRTGQPVRSPVNQPAGVFPYDTYLVPVRDLDSGKL